MNALRIGWIGCGTAANEMPLPQLTRFDVTLAALCDTDRARPERTGARFGVTPGDLTGNWRDVLARRDLDALGLAVGPQGHFEIGLAPVEPGLPVFMEKP